MLQNAEMWWWPTISSQANVVWVSSFYCMQPQKFVGKYEAIIRWKVFYVLLTTPPTKREEGITVVKKFSTLNGSICFLYISCLRTGITYRQLKILWRKGGDGIWIIVWLLEVPKWWLTKNNGVANCLVINTRCFSVKINCRGCVLYTKESYHKEKELHEVGKVYAQLLSQPQEYVNHKYFSVWSFLINWH